MLCAWQIEYEIWECGLLVFAEIYSVAVSLLDRVSRFEIYYMSHYASLLFPVVEDGNPSELIGDSKIGGGGGGTR